MSGGLMNNLKVHEGGDGLKNLGIPDLTKNPGKKPGNEITLLCNLITMRFNCGVPVYILSFHVLSLG